MRDLGLTPHQFWSLTFAELHLMIEGHQQRKKEAWQHTAYLATTMLNIHKNFKAPLVKVDDLLQNNSDNNAQASEPIDQDYFDFIENKYKTS